MHFGAELRLWRGRLVVLLATTLMLLNMPAARADQGTPTSRCLVKQGPVGNAFVDCSGGQVFNIVPPGETGTYDSSDFARAQAGLALPPHTGDQEPLYANLLNVAPSLATADISKYYKDAAFLADLSQAERVETFPLHPGTVIIRDSQFGVPHIYGTTRADTEFGAGFASAEDRLFEMDVLRHVGRAQLTSFIGPSSGNIAMDCGVAAAAGYSESELQQQVDNFAIQHPDPITIGGVTTTEGQQIKDDAAAYVNGVNEYETEASALGGGVNHAKLPAEYGLLQIPLLPWKATDIVSTATLIQAIFATGGGNEVASALLYQSLVNRYGQAQGSKVWSDLRSQNDPEAQTSIKTRFNYEQVPPASSLDPNSLAMPVAAATNNHCNPPPSGVPGQFSAAGVTVDLTPLLASLQGPPHLSNELIVDAAHSATGHPVAVFGPQTSYYVPELLHEVDLHGPGLQARGVSFPGTEVFVELGHGVDYAWSATSAGADIVDQRIEKLCNPDGTPASLSSTSYVFDDGNGGGPKCIPMYERTDTQVGKPSPGCIPQPPDTQCQPTTLNIQIERTVHGPVVGRTTAIVPGTLQAVPVAVSSQRSTFGDELGSAPAFLEWNDPDIIHNATDFQRAAAKETGTFNWTYVDSRDVAYYMAGKLPVRNPHINPNFPTWGTGQWEWQGFAPGDLSAADPHPRASTILASSGIVNGTFSNGFFTNWNNKPAPGFSAADNQYAYGPVYRVQSLSDRVAATLAGGHLATEADIINAMEDGGSVDLDGAQLVGPMAAVLSGASLTTKEQQVLTILQNWAADPFWGTGVPGAHRRDRTGSGSYEQGSAVAIMDKLYPRLAHAVFDPWLDSGQFGQLNGLNPMLDAPRAQGSAYDGGWEGYLQRALRQAVNPAIANGYSQVFCGGRNGASGNLTDCQAALKAALDSTITQLDKIYDTQTQTCPVGGNASADPDPVTLVGPPMLSPDHMFSSYSISSSETAGEKTDGLPHGVTISFALTTIDTAGGSSTTNPDATPSTGSASGDFTTAASFQLRGELPGTARTYQVDWTASFDGSNGVSVHKCSSTDGTHHPFTVTVQPPPAVPWTCSRSNDTGGIEPGSGQGDNTRCNPALDDIDYAVVGVGTVPDMPWVNRPTFQQVVQFPAGRAPGGAGEICHEGDGNGQVGDSQAGTASFKFDADPCDDGAPQAISEQDSSRGADFHSTQVQSVVFDDVQHSVTIAGLGTNSGHLVTFVLVAIDSTLVPGGLFSLVLSDGYARSGTLSSGTVLLH
jgi:acyl-homoserine lactone acylase PvdQ